MDCRNKSRANTPPRAGTGCRFFRPGLVDAPHPSTTHSLMPFSLAPVHLFTHLLYLHIRLCIHPWIYPFIVCPPPTHPSSIHPSVHPSTHPLVSFIHMAFIYCMADPTPGIRMQLWLRWTHDPLHGMYSLGQNQPSVGSARKSWDLSRTQKTD